MRPTIVLVLLLCAVLWIRSALAYQFDISFTAIEGLVTAVLGVTTALSAFLMSDEVRERISRKLRTFLGSPFALALTLGAFVVAGTLTTITRNSVVWVGPKEIEVDIDGQSEKLVGTADKDGRYTASIRALAWRTTRLSLPGFEQEITPTPLQSVSIEIPVHITAAKDKRIETVENSLLLTFFQFFESQRLNYASSLLATFPSKGAADLPATRRLEAIYAVLRRTFVDPDQSDASKALIEQFGNSFPGDPWIQLMQASRDFRRRDYANCTNRMTDELVEEARVRASKAFVGTALFFRGVCYMRQSISSPESDASAALLRKAVLDFERSERQLADTTDDELRAIAYPSSMIFQGIGYFYLKEEDSALIRLAKARDISNGGLKARALNGAAYLNFVNGNVDIAESELLKALDADQRFPYARSNYGFVLIAKNDLKNARKYFRLNADDETLKQTSMRDVVLAQVSLAHISEMEHSSERAIDEYAAILRNLGKNDFTGVEPPDLRLAFLLKEVAEGVYLNGSYYALEMFALNCECKADKLASAFKDDLRARELRISLRTKMQSLARKVNPKWLAFKQRGWFSALRDCNLTSLVVDGGPTTPSSN